MAVNFPMFTNRQQNQQTTGTPLNLTQERNRLNTEDQNNWTKDMNFLALAGNMAGNLDWKTLLGMALGFGLLKGIPNMFDRDKKSGTNEDSMNVEAIIGDFNPHAGENPRTEYYLDGGDFFNPAASNQSREKFDFTHNKLLGDPQQIFKKLMTPPTQPNDKEMELLKWNNGNWR